LIYLCSLQWNCPPVKPGDFILPESLRGMVKRKIHPAGQHKNFFAMNLQPYYDLVENCIRSLGVDPVTCRGKQPGQWDLRRGSASVWVDVFWSENNKCGYFQIIAPVMQIPDNNQTAFFRELLELNHSFYGVAFTIFKDWVYIKMIRELEGMDQNEALAMLNRVGWYADEYDDKLKAKYQPIIAGRG
jgi:hypothetical protein